MKPPLFILNSNIKLVGLGLYLEDIETLVVADLHLGYEQALSERGIHLPPIQLRQIRKILNIMITEVKPSNLIIAGDVKHEFGSALRQEWSEVIDLFEWLKALGIKSHVVRGNHDNFLIPILKKLEVPLHDPYYKVGRYLFIHGHKPLSPEAYAQDVELIIMGHEHPAVLISDELGIRLKFKCFLRGQIDDKELIVLPAISPLMPGTEVNIIDGRRILSPILLQVNLDYFRVYVVDMTAGIFDFGTVNLLKSMLFS